MRDAEAERRGFGDGKERVGAVWDGVNLLACGPYGRGVFLLMVLLLGVVPLLGQSYSVTGTTFVGYIAPGYLIDADRTQDYATDGDPFTSFFYSRWYLPVSSTVTVTGTSGSFRMAFRLIDVSTGDPVNLQIAGTGGVETRVFSGGQFMDAGDSWTFTANVVPEESVQLDPVRSYRVEAQLQRLSWVFNGMVFVQDWVNVSGATQNSASRTFVHFKGPWGSDLARNVVTRVTSHGHTRRYAIREHASQATFASTVNMTLYRYDEAYLNALSPGSDAITLRMTVQLVDNTGYVVPLAQNVFTDMVSVQRYNQGFFVPTPFSLTHSTVIEYEPLEQLDTVNRTYRLEATVEHLENPWTSFWQLARNLSTSTWRLMHLNGTFYFGGIETQLTTVTSVAAPGSPNGLLRDTTMTGATGTLNGGTHSYGPTGTLNISINAAGDAFIRAPSTVNLTATATPDRGQINGVLFDRGQIIGSDAGISAVNFDVILPAGMGLGNTSTARRLEGRVIFGGPIWMTQDLEPILNMSRTFTPLRWLVEESKPVAMAVSQINWDIAAGRFTFPNAGSAAARYVRAPEMTQLAALPVPADQRVKRNNAGYYQIVDSVIGNIEVQAGFNNGAELTAELYLDTFGPSGIPVRGHFPYDVYYEPREGRIFIENDRINPLQSHLILSDSYVTLPWSSGCSLPLCDDGDDTNAVVTLEIPSSGGGPRLGITADGGLYAAGQIPFSGLDLKWGYIESEGKFAHRVDYPFFDGELFISGHFINGADDTLGFPESILFGPARILLAGADANGELTERPRMSFTTATPYQQGLANYAGINLRLGPNNNLDSGIEGVSVLGGTDYGPYPLKNRSKYYIRASGVSGIHDKVATAPDTVMIYGYEITLTNFGLSFLSNSNIDSRTTGSVFLPFPADIKPEFDRLTFLCNGGLDQMDVASGSAEQTLSYWLAPIDLLAMRFASGNDCDVGTAYLTLAVNAYASHVEEPLSGTLGFFNHGNIIPNAYAAQPSVGLPDLDSRLRMPTMTTFRGPKRQTTQGGFEQYVLTPTADAYFNNPALPGDNWVVSPGSHSSGDGFINMAGRLKVSFFEAMPTHIQTSSNRPPLDLNVPGAWGTAVLNVANGRWQIDGNTSDFFGPDGHDNWNRGYPYPASAGGSDEDLNTYRTSVSYFPTVRQSWLGGAIVLKYKVVWNSTTRSFESLSASESVDAEDDYSALEVTRFVIIDIDHTLKYLSAERAELTFGASYDGLPTINLTNFVVNQIDETTGMFAAAGNAALDPVFGAINEAIDDMALMLSDNLRGYLERIIDEPVDLLVDNVYVFLQNAWNTATQTWDSVEISPGLEAFLFAQIDAHVIGPLNPAITTAKDQAQELADMLETIENGLITLRDDFLATDPGTDQLVAIQTLSRELLKMLSAQVGGTLGSLLDASGVDQRLNALLDPHLEFAKPTVAQIHQIVSDLTDVVGQIRSTLVDVISFDFKEHLSAIITNANAEIGEMKAEILEELVDALGEYGPAVEQGVNFLAKDPEEVKFLIKETIYDFVLDTVMIEQIQVAIKQRVKDVEVAIRQAIDNAFNEVNKAMKEAVVDYLQEVDDKINGALGPISDKLGSGSLSGYAIFNGDALRKVRIDGTFELKIPDEITIKAFLEINQYTSIDQPPGCITLGPGEAYTEVILGALDVGCNFIAPDLRVNVSAKFAMASGPGPWSLRPDGFGGSFEMASGELSFEAFTITELKCGMMFSSTEAYITAALGMKIGDYGAKGGVFFGRTCTLEPIELWDPLVASAIGEPNPSFTGAYVYGEAHIPVSEVILGIPASCMLKITADAGVGFFYFVEGPTFGARLGLGVQGEVLCLVTIAGRIDMVGARVAGQTRLKGKGRVRGEIGPCSFCIKFNRSMEFETTIGSDGKMAGKGGTK